MPSLIRTAGTAERPATTLFTVSRGFDLAGRPVVTVTGELDLVAEDRFRRILFDVIGRSGPDVILDLAGVTFCDARGLAVLTAARNRAVAAGGSLTLRNVPERLRRLLKVTQLDRPFRLTG